MKVKAATLDGGRCCCFAPVYAASVKVGQLVLLVDNNNEPAAAAAAGSLLHPAVVTAVGRDLSLRGRYAPLTAEGTILVNGVAASCYAVVDSYRLVHAAFAPVRWFYLARRAVTSGHAARGGDASSSSDSFISSNSDSDSSRKTRIMKTPQGNEAVAGVFWYVALTHTMAGWVLPARQMGALPVQWIR